MPVASAGALVRPCIQHSLLRFLACLPSLLHAISPSSLSRTGLILNCSSTCQAKELICYMLQKLNDDSSDRFVNLIEAGLSDNLRKIHL